MSPNASPRPAIPKVRRVRVYTRLSHALRTRLLAYCAATGRSERAVIEDAVTRYLAHPARDSSASGPLDRLAQAIDDDRRLRERQHRDLEIVSEAFGRFLRLWMIVHASTFKSPETPEAAQALSRQRAGGEALFQRFAASVADHFLRGHRFGHDLPGLGPRAAAPARRAPRVRFAQAVRAPAPAGATPSSCCGPKANQSRPRSTPYSPSARAPTIRPPTTTGVGPSRGGGSAPTPRLRPTQAPGIRPCRCPTS